MITEYWTPYQFGECMVGLNYARETGLLDDKDADILKERLRGYGRVLQEDLRSGDYVIKMVMDRESHRLAKIGLLSNELLWLLVEHHVELRVALKDAILLEIKLFESQKELEHQASKVIA